MTYWQGKSSGAAKNRLTISMIVGTLLVPISAVAAILLADPGQPAQADTTPSVSTTAPATAVDATTVFQDAAATVGDLRAACGYVGMTLVDAERNGTITDIQQAALDALRDICDEQGLSLPGPPTPDETVQTVVAGDSSSSVSSATSSTPTASGGDDGYESSEHEGGEGD